jgi:hypothetical protein
MSLIDIPADARQMRDARDGPEEFVGWLQRVATESAPRLVDALGNPREPGKLHVVADGDVIGDFHRSGSSADTARGYEPGI